MRKLMESQEIPDFVIEISDADSADPWASFAPYADFDVDEMVEWRHQR